MKLSPKLNLPIPEGSDIHNLTNFVTLLNAIDNNAAPLETVNNHINNKNNPHAVTKAQVGLSQVNNVSQYSKGEMDSKLSDLSKLTQLPADSVPSTGTPASFPIGVTVMTVTTGYPGATTNSPSTLMTIRGSNDRGTYQLLSGNGTPQQRAYDGVAWGGWSTVATTASNVASATKLANARKIGGVTFDGTSDIALPGVNAPGNQPTSGKATTAGRADTATHADNATSANKLTTPRKIGGVAFDGSADVSLPGVNIAGNQDTTGKAATAGRAETSNIADAANKLSTPRKIGGVAFDGSAPIDLPGVNIPGNQDTSGKAATAGVADSATRLANTRKIGGVNFDATANINLPGVNITGNQNTSGRAATAGRAETAGTADVAVRLNVPRKIGGVTFDGTKDVALPGVNTAGNQDTSGRAATAGKADSAATMSMKPRLGNGTDINTIKTNGLYPWGGVIFKNGPVTTRTWGYMRVTKAPGVIMQTFYIDGSNQVYHRTYGGDPQDWTTWQKVIFDSDKIANAAHADTATNTTGNANTTTKLQTARTIGGVSFNGTANINLPGVNTPGNQNTSGKAASSARADMATCATKANKADEATQLTTARKIGGVYFDGTKDIAIPAGNVGAYTKSQTDNKDTVTLASAKSYADAKLNNLSGVSNWTTSGITLGAGVRWYSDKAQDVGCFKVIDFGGWQLVMIHGAVTNVTKAGQVIINLPKSIAPDLRYQYTSPSTGQKHTRFLLNTNGDLVTENTSTGTYDAGDWIPFDTLYLRKG